MSKIICDICGTTYQDTADCCPICGCSRDAAATLLGDDLLLEEIIEEPRAKGGRFSTRKKKEIFDYDEVNADLEEEPVDEEGNPYDGEEEYAESGGHNTVAVVLLTVLIAVLLLAAAFLFVRFYLPNLKSDDPVTPTVPQVQETTSATTEQVIPCQNLVLTSGTAELSKEGQYFLLHVIPVPENTTDKIVFTSADESIATVTDDGRITAISEGETVIYITCGNQQYTCPVVCHFVEETVPPTEETVPETQAEETEAASVEADPGLKSDVVLKLQKTDIMLGVYYEFQLMLDCDLEQNEVEWSSEHPHIATVDENGVVKALKSGTTSVTAKYGDQEVTCIIRCG